MRAQLQKVRGPSNFLGTIEKQDESLIIPSICKWFHGCNIELSRKLSPTRLKFTVLSFADSQKTCSAIFLLESMKAMCSNSANSAFTSFF